MKCHWPFGQRLAARARAGKRLLPLRRKRKRRKRRKCTWCWRACWLLWLLPPGEANGGRQRTRPPCPCPALSPFPRTLLGLEPALSPPPCGIHARGGGTRTRGGGWHPHPALAGSCCVCQGTSGGTAGGTGLPAPAQTLGWFMLWRPCSGDGTPSLELAELGDGWGQPASLPWASGSAAPQGAGPGGELGRGSSRPRDTHLRHPLELALEEQAQVPGEFSLPWAWSRRG